LSYFPINLSYRYTVRLTPNPKADTIVILSTRGNRRRAVRAGWFEFVMDGRKMRLQATRLLEPGVGEKDYSIFFRDATGSKKRTAWAGTDVEPRPDAASCSISTAPTTRPQHLDWPPLDPAQGKHAAGRDSRRRTGSHYH
jgi:uncharacterized protein (DUF1684 family)